jgi:hypothetical protein
MAAHPRHPGELVVVFRPRRGVAVGQVEPAEPHRAPSPVTVASIQRACSSLSSPGKPRETSSSGSFDRIATPLKPFWPWVSTL